LQRTILDINMYHGGSSPSKGFDCSGFTTYVYKHFGVSLSRTSSGQSGNGKSVSKENMQAGDVICFSNSSGSKKIGHVGIYVGGGKFIHSANSRKGVIISNVSGDGYYFVTARRIIN
jgi:cell wall-associated NlpC family hydrolase